jgi:hypothetical protein
MRTQWIYRTVLLIHGTSISYRPVECCSLAGHSRNINIVLYRDGRERSFRCQGDSEREDRCKYEGGFITTRFKASVLDIPPFVARSLEDSRVLATAW